MDLPQGKGNLEKDYSLIKLNTWRVGGRAEFVFWPEDTKELVQMVQWCKEKGKPVHILGRGSNVLLPDQGIKGMVIVTTKLNKIDWQKEIVTMEAGYSLMLLAREAVVRGLNGLEFACGIPGTVGAAIAINAGAYGKEIGALVEKVQVLSPEGEVVILHKEDIHFAYRKSSLLEKDLYVLNSSIRLTTGGDRDATTELMNGYMAKRRNTQPLEYPNAGSVFRNPPGESAGRLIELAGWKGRKVGGAQVSDKHANFIINLGNAKSKEILTLISEIQVDIKEKFGIELEPEIRVISG